MQGLVLVASAAVASAGAQIPAVPGAWPSGAASINSGWRVHAGDDPDYAAPAYNDESWVPVTLSENYVLAGPEARGSSRWMRRLVPLPAAPGPVDLLLIADPGTLEVYVDGVRVGPPIAPALTWKRANELRYPLRTAWRPARSQVEVAIRSHAWFAQQSRRLTPRSASVGTPDAIATLAAAHNGLRLGITAFSASVNLAGLLLGMLLLVIYLKQRTHREYLWLGLTVALAAADQGMVEATINGFIPLAIDAFIGRPAHFLFMAAELAFVYAFIGGLMPAPIRVYQGLLLVASLVVAPLAWLGLGSIYMELVVTLVLIVPVMILVVLRLANWYRHGSREAGLLIVPLFLLNAANIVRTIDLLIRFARPGFAVSVFRSGLLVIQYEPLAQLLFLITTGAVIVLRFVEVSREQAMAQGELAAARIIQQLLVPQAFAVIPGLHVESVYLPAQQVGGDFFQILPLPAGGALAVMGDVSGKGLPAAMNVALIVGALRTLVEYTDSPGAILEGLHRRLHGRSGGFTTCLILRIFPSGRVTLANAGHINPYLAQGGSAREVLTDASLPLGLDLDLDSAMVYAETHLTLAPGDCLTLLTDGVIEARNRVTGELFGFERAAAIGGQSAQSIADTAKTFGQEDDIAVLTLRFQPV